VNIYQWGTASSAGIILLIVSLIGYGFAIRIGGMKALMPGSHSVGKGTVEREKLRFGPSTLGLWAITVLVIGFLLLPLIVIVPAAFTEGTQLQFPPRGFSFRWFEAVLTDPLWTRAIGKSIRVAMATAVVAAAFGLAIARVASTVTAPWLRSAIRTFAFAPLIVPVILLAAGNFDVQIQTGLIETEVGLVLLHSLVALPLTFLILNNALERNDRSLEEASWSMGVSRIRTFWFIVVPVIAPSVAAAAGAAFVTSWDEPVLALFQTGLDKTLPVTIFSYLQSGVTPAIAAVAVVLILPVALGIIAMLLLNSFRSRHAKTGTNQIGGLS
jgi:putative spermidine/putrescine transport system permease protein